MYIRPTGVPLPKNPREVEGRARSRKAEGEETHQAVDSVSPVDSVDIVHREHEEARERAPERHPKGGAVEEETSPDEASVPSLDLTA